MNKTTLNSQKEKHSMLSLRRATPLGEFLVGSFLHFYPRSPCGERLYGFPLMTAPCSFLSTLSLRRATSRQRCSPSFPMDFYPRSPCGERLAAAFGIKPNQLFLSTLSLRRATRTPYARKLYVCHFYPRSPCGERRNITTLWPAPFGFLSTLSLRRATGGGRPDIQPEAISIHALLAESDNINSSVTTADKISIHALLAESDRPQPPQGKSSNKFLSTLSLRRATHYDNYNLHCVEISIHALLAESDRCFSTRSPTAQNFYPRSPCGERPLISVLCRPLKYFYPRSPCGERHICIFHDFIPLYFYPRSPCGERPCVRRTCTSNCSISIHALLAESDFTSSYKA